ncbi:hypothetical protein GCM10027589_20260 [Actinocorallia lasiicapitis]
MTEGEQDALTRCLNAIEARGAVATAAEIGRRTGFADGQVRKILSGERPLRPEFLRGLGEYAGLRVSDLFVMVGWLPEAEALAPFTATLVDDTYAALEALEEARPRLEQLARLPSPAPVAAAEALLADVEGAERFEVRFLQIISGGRYRAVTNSVGEFLPRDGCRPLSDDALRALASRAGLRAPLDTAELGGDPVHRRFRLELLARTAAALNNGHEHSWQGGEGHRTWRSASVRHPAHLLVQDMIGGRQRTDAGGGAAPAVPPGPIVVVGGRHGLGLAGALLAQALGRRYVLVRENIDVTRHGHVVAVPSDTHRHRSRAWISVADHIARRASEGRPWPAVITVRAAAFANPDGELDPHAVRLLRETSARVVHVRVPDAYIDWWAERIAGNYPLGVRDGAGWAERTRAQYAALEKALLARRVHHDLLLRVPDPAAELVAHTPEVPAEVFDWTARTAWTVLRRMTNAAATPRPGLLADWSALLSTDPDATVPAL